MSFCARSVATSSIPTRWSFWPSSKPFLRAPPPRAKLAPLPTEPLPRRGRRPPPLATARDDAAPDLRADARAAAVGRDEPRRPGDGAGAPLAFLARRPARVSAEVRLRVRRADRAGQDA